MSGRKLALFAAAGAAAIGAGLRLGGAGVRPGVLARALAGYQPSGTEAATRRRLTLDPNLFRGEIREAYEAARRNPALLSQLHCYCGCDRTYNHRSLLDCFRDEHGSRCKICVGEARDGIVMASQGTPLEQIRDALRARYAHEE